MGNDKVIDGLMFDFLKTAYPVIKIKFGGKFKRGVDLDGKNVYLPSDSVPIYLYLRDMLKSLYVVSDKEATDVINRFYNFK